MEPGTTMIINRFTLLGAVLTTLVLSTSIQAADKFYKWTDDAGVVHYGENPPDPGKAVKVNVHTGKSSEEAVEKLEDNRAQAAAAGEKAADNAAKDKIADENAKIVKENCEIYRQNLSALQNSARIREKDAKGEYRYLTDEEKAERTKAAETYLQENCK